MTKSIGARPREAGHPERRAHDPALVQRGQRGCQGDFEAFVTRGDARDGLDRDAPTDRQDGRGLHLAGGLSQGGHHARERRRQGDVPAVSPIGACAQTRAVERFHGGGCDPIARRQALDGRAIDGSGVVLDKAGARRRRSTASRGREIERKEAVMRKQARRIREKLPRPSSPAQPLAWLLPPPGHGEAQFHLALGRGKRPTARMVKALEELLRVMMAELPSARAKKTCPDQVVCHPLGQCNPYTDEPCNWYVTCKIHPPSPPPPQPPGPPCPTLT
jgi:hypothetical protein